MIIKVQTEIGGNGRILLLVSMSQCLRPAWCMTTQQVILSDYQVSIKLFLVV